MKKIGTEKHLLSISENNLRNGEGAFLRLKDGRIMYAYTKYNGIGGSDHDTAYIAAVYSSASGATITAIVPRSTFSASCDKVVSKRCRTTIAPGKNSV